MAEDVGGLYLRLGLSLSELETGFVTASQTVAANIARLNREANLIRLRTEVEIAGLDEATDGERILQLRTESLNRQMQIQRDRIRILTAEYNSLVAAHGETSVAAQRAATRLERERLSLANLERDLRNLNGATDETNGVFGELSEMLPSIPTKLQAIGVAFGAVTAGVGAAATATKELLNEFHELQNQAYELNMSFPDTRNFLREMRLAGGDIGDFEGYIRGITDAYVKGEYDDPEFVALRKYGAEITDATGRLKSFKDITEEVYQAWLKADAAGEGIEFLQLTGGEAGVRDAIQYFQRLKEAREDADKIFTAKIDEKQLHELDRTMNLVTEQSAELKAALGDIFTPAAQAAGEKFFQILHDGTQILVENKDAIQGWGFIVAETIDTLSKKFGSFTDKLAEIAKTPKGTTGNAETDKIMSGMSWRYQEFNQQTPWQQGKEPWKNFPNPESNHVLDDIYQRAKERQKAYNKEVEEIAKSWADFRREVEEGAKSWADFRREVEKTDKTLADKNPLNQYALKRVQQFRAELEDLKIELNFDGKDYLKSFEQLKLWKQRESAYKNFLSDEEQKVIDDLYAAKFDKIKQEQAEKVQQYWQNAADIEYEMTHTAFEKELRDIERWKEAQQEKASTAEEIQAVIAESAAKEAQAFEREMDRIKGKLQSLDDKIFEIDHSQYENDLRRVQQEYVRGIQEWQEQGLLTPEIKSKLDYLLSRQTEELNKRASKNKDYRKSPTGVQSAGNGIMFIGGDKVIDDGLIRSRKQEIGLITDTNQLREQMLQTLPQDARDIVSASQATRQFAEAQKNFAQKTQQAASGFEMILGDKVVGMPQIEIPQVSMPQLPTGDLQEFGSVLEQTEAALKQADPTKALAQATQGFPPEYFNQLADGTQAVSEMQMRLTESTMKLIDAQGNLANALLNLPLEGATRPATNNQQSDGMMKLTTNAQELARAQETFIRTTNETDARLRDISDIPPKSQLAQKDSGVKLGFDWDVFGGIGAAAITGLEYLTAIGTVAPHPGAKLLALVGAGGLAGLAKGTYDETTAAREQQYQDPRLQELPKFDSGLPDLKEQMAEFDRSLKALHEKIQPAMETALPENVSQALSNVDIPLSSVLQELQKFNSTENPTGDAYADDRYQELFGTLPNIEANVQSILQQMQLEKEIPAMQETQLSSEAIVTPLNNISGIVQNILTALTNRQPPTVTVSPNVDIDLGGAYVFDEKLKASLVEDITREIVTNITSAVQQATSKTSYGYGV